MQTKPYQEHPSAKIRFVEVSIKEYDKLQKAMQLVHGIACIDKFLISDEVTLLYRQAKELLEKQDV